MAAELLRPLGLTLQAEPHLHTLLLASLPLRSLVFYYFLSCAAAAGSLPGLDYDYGISPKFVCTPIPPDADPSCFSPPGPPHGPGGTSSHANDHVNDHAGGTRHGAMSDEAKATILHLRESLVRQKETILDQRETIRELTAKLTLCEGFGGHHSMGHHDNNHRDGHHDDHHGPRGGHHVSTSHHGPSGYHTNENHYGSHRPDPHHRKSPPSYTKHSSFSPEQTGKTLQTLKERLENLQARNSSSSYSSSLRELLQRKINALEEQLRSYYRDHHDDHHDDHHGQHDDHHGNGHHDDHHGNGHHDDHHGNGHHDDHHSNGHHDDHHSNGRHDDHHSNGRHDDHHSNGRHDDHHSNGRHDDHHGNSHHDDHHGNGHHDDHHGNGHHDDHHGNGHHDDHHGNGHHDDHHSSRGHHGTQRYSHHGGHHSRHRDHHYDGRHGHHGYHGNHHTYHHDDHHNDHHGYHDNHHDTHHGGDHHDDHHDYHHGYDHHDDHHDTHHGGDHHDDHHDYHHGYDHHHDDSDHHLPFGGKETSHSKLETVLSQLHHDHENQKKLKSPSAFLLDFPMRTNYMYARMKRSLTNEIFAMTVCLWLKAGAGPGLGTPFSYAVPGQANELVLMEWGANPMELLINDKAVTLPVTLSDHKWHHVCVTWATRDGTWEVYQDGVKKGSGQNLSAWQPIKPGGVFILGQEQDTLGGRFDVTQSFMGQLAHLQLWSRVLTPAEIHSQATCGGHLVGDVLWWHEEALELHGGLAELPFDACH